MKKKMLFIKNSLFFALNVAASRGTTTNPLNEMEYALLSAPGCAAPCLADASGEGGVYGLCHHFKTTAAVQDSFTSCYVAKCENAEDRMALYHMLRQFFNAESCDRILSS
ncbi:hypothetical protein BDR26DRAFT_541535 [Obelidium mucronatum]|nr:hypothetical protein BDR26DRAFT_541535 [Obelidium mucronatum]